jgi:hypothetical protein
MLSKVGCSRSRLPHNAKQLVGFHFSVAKTQDTHSGLSLASGLRAKALPFIKP